MLKLIKLQIDQMRKSNQMQLEQQQIIFAIQFYFYVLKIKLTINLKTIELWLM